MTMRQTVAGAASTAKSSGKDANRGRSPSELAPPSKPAAPQIQSIRHTPLPSRTGSGVDARTSMAEILAQQQFEKTAVEEAVAKRSLQEIQQEQEFQQWWDNESRRVQEEEEAHSSTAASSGRGKGGRGRGGHRRGSGRGKSTSGAESGGREKAMTASPTVGEDFGRGRGSQRGSGRGRSQGNSQQRWASHQ